MIRRLSLLVALVLIAALAAGADEFKLKDGSKIEGTIVGFEGKSFKVKTSYGFALVRKDQIASIRMTNAPVPPAASAPKKSLAAEKKSHAESATPQSVANPEPPAQSASVGSAAQVPSNSAATAQAPAVATNPSVSSGHAPAVPANASLTPAAAPPAPPPIQEQVSGNVYTNETYGFSMFKPPDWELIPGARKLLPGAIMAMGTDDQTTYLLIGEDPAGKSLQSQMAGTVDRLAGILDNFQPLAETRLNISGGPAIERRFHGTVDQHDWSGVIVLIPRGRQVFTIFGMTYAETDLVQIEENVIARAISSIQFAKQ